MSRAGMGQVRPNGTTSSAVCQGGLLDKAARLLGKLGRLLDKRPRLLDKAERLLGKGRRLLDKAVVLAAPIAGKRLRVRLCC